MEIKFKTYILDHEIQIANNILAKIVGIAPEGLQRKIIKNKLGQIEMAYLKIRKSKYKKYTLNDIDVTGVAFDNEFNRIYFLCKSLENKTEPFACIDWI